MKLIHDKKYWKNIKNNYEKEKIEKQAEYFKKENLPKRFQEESVLDYVNRKRTWKGYRELFKKKLRKLGIKWEE